MARLGTALQRRPEPEPPGRERGALGRRLAGAVERRSASEKESGRGALSPVGERVVAAFERRLARAVEQRLGARTGDRRPGRVERLVVAAVERRLSAGRGLRGGGQPAGPAGLAWVGRAVQRPSRRAPASLATRPTTLRGLVVGLVARGVVRALVLLVRLFGRTLVSGPIRRLVRLLARRAIRAEPTHQLGFLALLLGMIALAVQVARRRLAGMSEPSRAAITLGWRVVRLVAPRVRQLVGRLLRFLAAVARRRLGTLRGPPTS